jgi:hypothetical protein
LPLPFAFPFQFSFPCFFTSDSLLLRKEYFVTKRRAYGQANCESWHQIGCVYSYSSPDSVNRQTNRTHTQSDHERHFMRKCALLNQAKRPVGHFSLK